MPSRPSKHVSPWLTLSFLSFFARLRCTSGMIFCALSVEIWHFPLLACQLGRPRVSCARMMVFGAVAKGRGRSGSSENPVGGGDGGRGGKGKLKTAQRKQREGSVTRAGLPDCGGPGKAPNRAWGAARDGTVSGRGPHWGQIWTGCRAGLALRYPSWPLSQIPCCIWQRLGHHWPNQSKQAAQ